jgi:hypothetical protein
MFSRAGRCRRLLPGAEVSLDPMKIYGGLDMHQHVPFTERLGSTFQIIVVLAEIQQFLIGEVLANAEFIHYIG